MAYSCHPPTSFPWRRLPFFAAIAAIAIPTIAFATEQAGSPSLSSICAMTPEAGVEARLVQTVGRVERQATGGRWETLTQGAPIRKGDRLRTQADSMASLVAADESLIRLKGRTELVVEHIAQRAGWIKPAKPAGDEPQAQPRERSLQPTRLNLNRGGIWLMNKDRNTAVDIQTIHAKVGVRGTELSLQVEDGGDLHVATLEGFANVESPAGNTVVGKGEELVVGAGKSVRKGLLLQPENAVQWTVVVQPLFGSRSYRLASGPRPPTGALRELFDRRDGGDLTGAFDGFKSWLAAHPGDELAQLGQAWVLLDRQDYAGALAQLNAVPPSLPMASLGRAMALTGLERFPEARALVMEGARREPQDFRWSLQRLWIDLLAGEAVSAYPDLLALVARHPRMAEVHTLLAIAALARNRVDEGMQAARTAVELAPNEASGWVVLSYLQQAAFDLDAAEISARRAMEQDPSQSTAWLAAARLLFGSGRSLEARDLAEQALTRFPGHPDLLALRGYLRLAQRHERAAEADFLQAAASRGSPEACMGLGLVWMRLGAVEPALEAITTAVTMEPRRALLRTYWAKMLYQVARHQKALDVLGMAKELDPKDPTNPLYEGMILRDLRRPTEAVQAIQQAIGLNDYRAVYRSRMLLDQDLAVKNVDLSRIYTELGLDQWARGTALASLHDDYANASAHLLLAGSLTEDADRSWARNTEHLLARLLQPANVNTFNTFNDYTVLFEQPALHGGVDLSLGRRRYMEVNLYAFGADPNFNLAWALGSAREKGDGWRKPLAEEKRGLAGYFKWDPTEQGSIMGAIARTDTAQVGLTRRYEYDVQTPERDGSDGETTRMELGYHHHLGVGSDLLFHTLAMRNATGVQQVSRLNDATLRSLGLPQVAGLNWEANSFTDLDTQQSFSQLQGVYLGRLPHFQWQAGGIHYQGREWLKGRGQIEDLALFDTIGNRFTDFPALPFALYTPKQDRLHDTLFATASGTVAEGSAGSLVLTGGIHLDRMETGDLTANTTWTREAFSPRLGTEWRPTPDQTVRLAAFRSLLPFAADRIDPATVAGVPVLRNGLPGVVTDEADLAWERTWSQGFASLGVFHLERDYETKRAGGTMSTQEVRASGLQGGVEWILGDGLAGFAKYRIMDQSGDAGEATTRKDHLGEAGLKWIHPSGWSIKAKESYRYLDFPTRSTRNDEGMWITDLETRYAFPGKGGDITLGVKNLFDSHFNWVTDDFIFQGREPAMQVKATLSLYW